MEELKREFLDFAYNFYTQYVENYSQTSLINPDLLLPISYIEFAREETFLFKLLFITEMELNMREINDFYSEPGNEEKAKIFSGRIGKDL